MKNATHTPLVGFWALFKALTVVVQFSLDSPLTSRFNKLIHPKKFHLHGGRFSLFAEDALTKVRQQIDYHNNSHLSMLLFVPNMRFSPEYTF